MKVSAVEYLYRGNSTLSIPISSAGHWETLPRPVTGQYLLLSVWINGCVLTNVAMQHAWVTNTVTRSIFIEGTPPSYCPSPPLVIWSRHCPASHGTVSLLSVWITGTIGTIVQMFWLKPRLDIMTKSWLLRLHQELVTISYSSFLTATPNFQVVYPWFHYASCYRLARA